MMFTLVLGVIFYDLFNMAGFSYIDEIVFAISCSP